MSTPEQQLAVVIFDEHMFVYRSSNQHPVWLGRKDHVNALDPEQVYILLQYRLAFDERCCARVM